MEARPCRLQRCCLICRIFVLTTPGQLCSGLPYLMISIQLMSMRSRLFWGCCLVWAGCQPLQAQPSATVQRAAAHAVECHKPAQDFFEGALLGNGAMGVVVTTRPDAVCRWVAATATLQTICTWGVWVSGSRTLPCLPSSTSASCRVTMGSSGCFPTGIRVQRYRSPRCVRGEPSWSAPPAQQAG